MAIDDTPGTDEETAFAEQAEEVRSYLVGVRGGAPFLSSADARLLVSWLDAEVPIPTILSAIDRVAERRRRRRVRTRMSLTSCKGEVKKALDVAPDPVAAPVGSARSPDLAPFLAKVEALDPSPERDELLAGLRALGDLPIDDLARAAIACCRRFHEAVFEAADGALLLAEARAELAALEGAVSEAVFADLLAEVARDRLRRLYPVVSAQEVWDTLNGASTTGDHA